MRNMTLSNIAKACGGQLKGILPSEGEVSGVVLDSRQVEKDYLFIAVKGERADGHDYIASAFGKGAMAVVCEKEPEAYAGPYILVKDSLQALKDIAQWYRSQLPVKVVGITGSVGKTSTKEFISSVLSQKYSVLKTEGNYNNEIGLPLTILKIRDHHEIAVLEMGISNFGEMHRLSRIARPDIAVITNIGQCHLENLGSRQGILKAKTEIFDYMSEKGIAVLNGDDDMLAAVRSDGRLSDCILSDSSKYACDYTPDEPSDVSKSSCVHAPDRLSAFSKSSCDLSVYRYGMKQNEGEAAPDYLAYASNIINRGLSGSSADIHISGDRITVDIPLPGTHMVLNALAAATVGHLLGLTAEQIAAGISSVKPLGGRSNIITNDRYTIIDDCYNANPVSMRAALDLLSMADTRKVAILGDMGELGEREKELHMETGAYAASKNIDVIACVGKLAAFMVSGARKALESGASSVHMLSSAPLLMHYETREDLISALPEILKDHDTVLVKASHMMGFDNIIEALQMKE